MSQKPMICCRNGPSQKDLPFQAITFGASAPFYRNQQRGCFVPCSTTSSDNALKSEGWSATKASCIPAQQASLKKIKYRTGACLAFKLPLNKSPSRQSCLSDFASSLTA